MALTIKPQFANIKIAFNGSGLPLGQRSQADLKLLLILSYTANRADYVAMFVSPPTLAELLGGSGTIPGADLTVATLLDLLSNNGTNTFTQDGGKIRSDLNAALDVPGGLQSVNGAAQLFYTKQQVDDLLTAFAGGGGGGVTDPAASILALPNLFDWYRPAAGITTVSDGADAWMGAKNHVLNAPSAVQRPVPNATGGANNRPYLGFVPGAGCVLTGTVNLPANTREIVVYIVMKEDSGSSYPFCLIGAYGEEFVVRYKGQGYVGATLKHDGGESNAEIQVTAGGWVIIRATGYLSEPSGAQVGLEGNGVAGYVQSDPEAGNAYSTVLDFRLGAINPGGALALTGGIADVLLFTGKESAPAKTLVTDYLKTKYNL